LQTPCAAHLASSSLAPRCVGTVRWHAHAHRVATASTHPIQLTIPTLVYGQNFHPIVCPSRCPLLPHYALCSTSAHPVYRRAKPSPPALPPCTGSRCPHVMGGYKRRPPLHLVCTRTMCTFGKPSLPHPPMFSAAPSVPSRLTPPLSTCAGPEAPQGPRAAPRPAQVTSSLLLSSGAIDCAGELHPSVTCLPRFELQLSTMSSRFTVHLECSL
jgi:hypothetical protein